ncbi:hypothetical protein OPAG_05344 [Rhodococcus opacus PD630]|nr:hypothetical protein Pd630_LPD04827 [Rhodococcus opacus PD630]EHI45312.1 hypothetical protein OPAG_05344 [Rhodococcus opacus PD630]
MFGITVENVAPVQMDAPTDPRRLRQRAGSLEHSNGDSGGRTGRNRRARVSRLMNSQPLS